MIRANRSLEFFNSQYLLRTTDGTAERYKFLSPAAVNAAFRNAPVDSGWLSPGIVRCGGGIGGDFAVLFIGPKLHALLVESERGKPRRITVPLPSLVFFGFGKSYYIWAIAEVVFTANAQLLHAPLPNVFSNGSICWGSNQPPAASSATILKAWELFLASPFNGHAASGKSRSHAIDVRDLLRGLARALEFPMKDLLSMNERLDTRINRLIGEKHVDD